MPYKIDWYIPCRVIYVEVYGEADGNLAVHLNNELIQFIEQGESPVYVISNIANIQVTNVKVKQVIESQSYLKNARLGQVLVVGGTTFTNFLMVIFNNLFGSPIKTMNSLEEAKFYLQQNGHGLDWTQAREIAVRNEIES